MQGTAVLSIFIFSIVLGNLEVRGRRRHDVASCHNLSAGARSGTSCDASTRMRVTRRTALGTSLAWWTVQETRADAMANVEGIARVLEVREDLRKGCVALQTGDEKRMKRAVAYAKVRGPKLKEDLEAGLPSVARVLSSFNPTERTWMGDRLGPVDTQRKLHYDQRNAEIMQSMHLLLRALSIEHTDYASLPSTEEVENAVCDLNAALEILILELPDSYLQRAHALRIELLLGGI